MPVRKFKGYRIDCEEVQGDEAYVMLARPSYEQIKQAQEMGKGGADNFDVAIKIISELLVSWNWVDDMGEPLPLPAQDPDVIRKLPLQEQNFLVTKFNEFGKDEEKN
jgi:hypothetical protein